MTTRHWVKRSSGGGCSATEFRRRAKSFHQSLLRFDPVSTHDRIERNDWHHPIRFLWYRRGSRDCRAACKKLIWVGDFRVRLHELLATEATKAPIANATHLPLDKILDRLADTRQIKPAHAAKLAESIAAIGLINAIAVDNQGRLLAGGHRRAAIGLLPPSAMAKWFSNGIPVRMFDFDAALEPDKALAVEASENEQRLNYTPAEVRDLADRLTAEGYRRTAGKPKKGEKALTPALAIIVGVSKRTIERHLNPQTPTPVGVSTQLRKLQCDLTRMAILEGVPDKIAEQCMKLAGQIEREDV